MAAVAGGYGSGFIVAATAIGLAGALLLGGGLALTMLSAGLFAGAAAIGVSQAHHRLNQLDSEQTRGSMQTAIAQEPLKGQGQMRSFADAELARREQTEIREPSR